VSIATLNEKGNQLENWLPLEPDRIAAGQLQDAADALRHGKMEMSTATALLDGYRQRSLVLRRAA